MKGWFSSTMAVLLAAFIVDQADLSLLPGLFRALEVDFGLPPKAMAGLVVTQSLCKGIAYPAWGVVADRRSRKSAMFWSCVAWAAAAVVVVFAMHYLVLILALGIGGVALAALIPVSQSIMADAVCAAQRGVAFGCMNTGANVGGLLGGALSTSISEGNFFGIKGWRVSFAVVAAASCSLAVAIDKYLVEPERETSVNRHERIGVLQQAHAIFSLRTFQLLVAQGMVGNAPWVAYDSFGVLWLQYVGFSNSQVAAIMVARRLGAAAGSCFGGWLSDTMVQSYGDLARVVCAMMSVLSGVPVAYVILQVLPRDPSRFVPFFASNFVLGFGASWCTPACNRPVTTEIVPPELRGVILGWFSGIETAISAFSAPAAAILAEEVFGYRSTTVSVNEMSEDVRHANVEALANSLLWTMLVPWAPCFLCYTLMLCTYPTDKARQHLLCNDENDWTGKKDDGQALLMNPIDSDTSEPEEDVLISRPVRQVSLNR